MQKLHSKLFSSELTLLLVLFFTSCAPSQNQPSITNITTRDPHEGVASGKPQPFDLRIAVLAQPVPDVWLEFVESKREGQSPRPTSDEKQPVIQVALPPEAREMLKSFWQRSLEFDYKDVFDKPKNAQEAIDRDQAWESYSLTMPQQLQKIEIAAPDGTRKISYEEARQLLFFLRKASGGLVQSVRQQVRS